MKLSLGYFQKAKTLLHTVQAILIAIAWCLTIAVFRDGGPTDGRTGWYFAVCFLSIPALIYQTMVPAWTRAERFSKPIAFVIIDALFAILWFSAFIAVATWNANGVNEGAKKAKDKKADGCATFGFGSERTCVISKTTVGFGVFIFILFGLATAMSFYAFRYYKKNGAMPGSSGHSATGGAHAMEDHTKDAFSTNVDTDPYAGHTGHGQDEEYVRLNDEEEGHAHPGQRVDWDREHEAAPRYEDTSYGGAYDERRDPFDERHAEVSPTYADNERTGRRDPRY